MNKSRPPKIDWSSAATDKMSLETMINIIAKPVMRYGILNGMGVSHPFLVYQCFSWENKDDW